MEKIWRRPALKTTHRATKMTFTVNKVDESGIIDLVQINTILLPRGVYNEILRDEKIQSLVNRDGKITVQDMYFSMLKYGENFNVELVDFERII